MKPGSIQAYEPSEEEKSLDFYVKARGGQKRDYIYSVGKALSCPHSRLMEIVVGSGDYRCIECNYVFTIVTAKIKPLHHTVIQGVQAAIHFAKEHGSDALQEVLRRPLGQYEGKAQRSVLPEGMSFEEAVLAQDVIDVNASDGGAAQLKELRDAIFVSPKSRERRMNELDGMDDHRLPPHLMEWRDNERQRELNGSDQSAIGEKAESEDGSKGHQLPSVQAEASTDTEAGNS
jgi:hypothetical protein